MKFKLLNSLKSILDHPLTSHLDLDSPEMTRARSRIIREKKFLRKLYEDWYYSIEKLYMDCEGCLILEIGSGSGFLNKILSNLVTSEILHIPEVNIVLDGQSLPFKRGTLQGIVLVDVFHHIPDVQDFLSEAAFCMKSGGILIMIEPWMTKWSKWIYKNLHHEPCDTEAKERHFNKGMPLSFANSALPWIVFERDREKFEREFPQWEIKDILLHTPFSYLLSGGISLRISMPGMSFYLIRTIENRFKAYMPSLAMFATIALERR